MFSLRHGLAGLAALGLFATAPSSALAADYTIDQSHTSVLFQLTHLNVSTFHGRFNRVEGSLTYDKAAPNKSALKLSIPTASIFTADKKRDEHLKAPDFFNVKQFPTITFESTSVTGTTDALTVTGNLTLLGQTKAITVAATKVGEGKDPWGGTRVGFDARFDISREAWGLGKTFPAEALGDTVAITIAIEAIQNK